MQNLNNNVTGIIRSVGERTERVCFELLKKQIPESNIQFVREKPFNEAVRKTFEVGIQENRKWTYAIDADLLIKPGVIKELFYFAETTDEQVFKITGKIIDKFIESPREGGIHLYRTAHMEHALNKIPDPYESTRPESFVRNEMNKIGFISVTTEIITGLHDFEQYYHDIYRKCFIHSKKHHVRVMKVLPAWEQLAINDHDYLIAINGFNAGCKYEGPVSIDTNSNFLNEFKNTLDYLSIKEKGELEDKTWLDDKKYLFFAVNALARIAIDQQQVLINRSLNISESQSESNKRPWYKYFKRLMKF